MFAPSAFESLRKKIGVQFFALAALLTGVALSAQNGEQIIRLDPALDALIPAGAQIEKVADGFGFLEGPAWVHTSKPGYLIFSDIPANAIEKWDPQGGKVFMYLEKSGFTGADPGDAGYQLNNGHAVVTLYGSNGITLDKQGRVTYCTHGDRDIVRVEKDGKRTVLADRFEGKRLNSPNDLVYKSDGSLYFTDTHFGLRKLADDFVEVHPGGFIVNKQEQIDQIKDPQRTLNELHPDDIQVRYVSPDVAVLTDVTTIRGMSGGVSYDGPERVIRVFVKQHGRWRAAGAGIVPIKAQ